jgi:hypothetical protein
VILGVYRLPENGTLVPKLVEVGTCYELCFVVFSSSDFIKCVCWLIY